MIDHEHRYLLSTGKCVHCGESVGETDTDGFLPGQPKEKNPCKTCGHPRSSHYTEAKPNFCGDCPFISGPKGSYHDFEWTTDARSADRE
jgi:hypothetical protein